MPLVYIVAKNIRKYRKKAGFSQEELAANCGLHRTYIGAVERGERNLSIKNIEIIAKALSIRPSQLLEGDNE